MKISEIVKKIFTKPVLAPVTGTKGTIAFSRLYCYGGESK